MGKTAGYSEDLLKLIFDGTTLADLAENDTTAPATDLYVSLHTADPSAGNQTTNETAYTGYARVAVARGAGWTVSGASVSPAAPVTFGICTAAPGANLTHWGIGTGAAGAGYLMYSGTLTPNVAMAIGVTPIVKDTSTVTES